MKLIFDLNKSAMTGKVQVQRTVNRGGTTFQQHFWVNPSDVKDTDVVVVGSNKNSLEISEKNFPVGSKIYYKGEEATVQRVGKEFSGGGMGIVVRFSKGGTGTIGKSDMKNVSKTPSSKDSKTDSVPDKAVGKTWSETKTELGKMGYKVDSIFSSNPPQPKEKLTLYKDGKEYEAEVTKYSNGDYEILGSSIKEVKKDDKADDKSPVVTNFKNGFVRYNPDGEKPPYHGGKTYNYFASRKGDAKGKYFDTKEEAEDYVNGNSNTKVRKVSNMSDLENGIRSVNRAIGKEHNIFNSVSVMGGGRLGEQLAMVHIPKLQTESNARKVIDEQLKREFGNSVKYSLKYSSTKQSDHFILSMTLDDNKTPSASTVKDTSQPKSDDKPTSTSGKFDASEFTKLKTDRPKALQYLKDKGITWKETDNEGINWMRACMSASKASNSDASATKKDSAGKSSTDSKPATKESKKSILDLLSANGNDRAKVMKIAKDSGVTWKESDNAGINWMRASLAIQKHHESGKTISTSASDDKKDDTKTDDKPIAKKVSISDLKRPASNNTSTNLVVGDYKITVHKFRNVGANSKQHPSFYHIDVEKNGDNVFRTDKTDWSDIKYHAQRYIEAASSSDSKSDKNSDSTSGVKQLKPANISTRDEFDIHSKVRKGELSKTPIGDSDKEMIKNIVPNYKSVLKESDTRCTAYSKNREYRFTKLSDSHFKCEVYEISNKKDTSRPIKTSWYETK